jgi:hypothetical protein
VRAARLAACDRHPETAIAAEAYWNTEMRPVLAAGFRPPYCDGLRRFLRCDWVRRASRQALDADVASTTADPFDSHPPLATRLAALGKPCPAVRSEAVALAVGLLENVDEWEAALLERLASRNNGKHLVPITWEEVGAAVYRKSWKQTMRVYAVALSRVKVMAVPELAAKPEQLRSALGSTASNILACALAGTLAARGWGIEYFPGAPVRFSRPGSVVGRLCWWMPSFPGYCRSTSGATQCSPQALSTGPLNPPNDSIIASAAVEPAQDGRSASLAPL